jgi:hypothetical protein
MEWARILAYITGTVDHELLLRNEYLAAENRILRGQLKGRLKFSDAERAKLGEIGRRLGRKAGDGSRLTLIRAGGNSISVRFSLGKASDCESCAIDPETAAMGR